MFFAKLNNIHIIYKFIVHSKHHPVPLLYVHGLRMVVLACNEYYLALFRCFPNLIANPLSKSRWGFIRNCFFSCFYRFPSFCRSTIRANSPPRAISSAGVPCSATVPSLSTTILWALATVRIRWAIEYTQHDRYL